MTGSGHSLRTQGGPQHPTDSLSGPLSGVFTSDAQAQNQSTERAVVRIFHGCPLTAMRSAHWSRVVDHCHEAEIHVQLLVAMEERRPRIVGDKIEFHFLKATQHHDIFDDAGGRFAADAY